MRAPTRKRTIRTALAVALAVSVAVGVGRALRPAAAPVVSVTAREIHGQVHGPGTVQSRVPVTVGAKITGILTRVHADQGDRVKRGQLLAELDSEELKGRAAAARAGRGRSERDLARARADLLRAEAGLELARSNFERDREVFTPGYISAAAFDASRSALRVAESEVVAGKRAVDALQAAAAQARHDAAVAEDILAYTRVLAPMDGLITLRKAEVGMTVSPGVPIFQMVNYQIWAASWIDERMIPQVREGQRAKITLRSGRVFDGEVARLGSTADTVTREVEVDVKFDTLPSPLVIGEESEVAIETGSRTAPAVPLSALLTRNGTQGVMVIADGRARFRPVVTGVQDGGRAAVVKGLREGELVAVRPAQVRPGERVRLQLEAKVAQSRD